MSRDPLKDYEADRQRRMEQAGQITKDSNRNSAGRFRLVERRKAEENARITAFERQKARDLWTRKNPGQAIPSELQEPNDAA